MACGMDEAGLLNSMTAEQLAVTCARLQRSCNDVGMLLSEFEEENSMLRREHARLCKKIEKGHKKIEKAIDKMEQAEIGKSIKQDRDVVWKSLIGDLIDTKQAVSLLLREKEGQKTSKRFGRADAIYEEEEYGPFSDQNIQMSWGSYLSLGVLRQTALKGSDQDNLDRWFGEALCPESVAEADQLPDVAYAGGAGMDKENQKMWSPRDVSPVRRVSEPWMYQKDPSRSPRADPSGSPKGHEVGLHSGDRDGGARFGAYAEGSTVEAQIASALGIGKQKASDQPAPVTFSRPGAFLGRIGDAISNFGAVAEPPTSSRKNHSRSADVPEATEATEQVMLTVKLVREKDGDKWGLSWQAEGFKHNKDRVVEKLVPGSIAEQWNQQRLADGRPDRCIKPNDRLISANGKTGKDEITEEMKVKEVVLQFQCQRVVPKKPEPTERPPDAPTTAPPPSTSAPARPSFGSAFSAYLEKSGVAVPQPASPAPQRGAGSSSHDQLSGAAQAAGTSQASTAETQEAETGLTALESAPTAADHAASVLDLKAELGAQEPAPPPRETPHGVVVQVLSRSSGTVRLSWLFDWEVVPEDLRLQESTARGFEVLQRQETADASSEQVVKVSGARPTQTLTVPPGSRYVFEVRAVLCRDGDGDGVEGDTQAVLWQSSSSASVSADLRDPKSIMEGSRPDSGTAAVTSPAPEARPKCGAVASKFSSFLAQQPAAASQGGGQGKVAVVMGGSAERVDPLDPLGLSRPRTAAHRTFDPAIEKKEISERLRMRRGLSVLDEPLPPRHRSFSGDSDDGSLLKLSSALISLERAEEKTAAAQRSPAGEDGPQESAAEAAGQERGVEA